VQSSVVRNNYVIDPQSKFVNVFTNYEDGYKFADAKSFVWKEQLAYKLNDNNSVIVGASYQDVVELTKTGDLPELFDPSISSSAQGQYYLGTDITTATGDNLKIEQDFHYVHYRNIGAYLQWQSQLTEKLNLTLGGRCDYNTRFGSTINPRVGLVYAPVQKMKFKALYGRAYLAPSPYKSYEHYGAFIPDDFGNPTKLVAPFWHLPNPDLKPEIINTIELSWSYFVSKKLGINVNGYLNESNNLIVNDVFFNQTFKGVEVEVVEMAVNKGKAQTYGGTVRLNYLTKFGTTGTANAYLAYSYSDGNIDDSPLTYSAKNTVKGGIDIQFGKLGLSPRFIYRTESNHGLLTDVNDTPIQNDAFGVLNLFVKYELLSKIERVKMHAFLHVNNLTNSKYYNLTLGGSETLGAAPQDPIKFTGGFSFKF
jgi:outer membrane receptor protein involved in Fe transport